MSEITLIGIDLAKNIFRINCLDENGKRVMNKNLHRESVVQFFASLSECTVAMEACASSHYWGRTKRWPPCSDRKQRFLSLSFSSLGCLY